MAGFFCRSEVTGHMSLFYQYRKYPKHILKANLRPKNIFLGLIRPKVNFWDTRLASVWDTFCIGKTMTCDLWPVKETFC